MARVVVLADYYLPASNAGGPVIGIRNVLADLPGHPVRVLTRDRDLGDRRPFGPPYTGSHRVDHAVVTYLPPARSPASWAAWWRGTRVMLGADVIYLNSIHSPMFAIAPLLLARAARFRGTVVVAPRGELSPGALAFSAGRKRLWHRLVRATGLDTSTTPSGRTVRWLASSEEEASDIARVFPGAPTWVVPERLRPTITALPARTRQAGAPFTLVYLGRVVPKKGLLELVEALALTRAPVSLRVVGALEEGAYVARVRAACRALPTNVTVEWVGAVPSERIGEHLLAADGFALLTRGENFGHAIGEALAYGVPVLLSDQTPWSFVEREGAGVLVAFPGARPPGPAAIAARLEEFLGRSPDEWQAMRAAAFRCGQRGLEVPGQVSVVEAFGLADSVR